MITDCLIVGAGPVGLTLACRLKQYGLSCRILDKLGKPVKRTKAAAIWTRSTEIFAQMELAAPLLKNGLKVYGATFFSGGKPLTELTLDSIDSVHNYVLMIAQHQTEKVLRQRLKEQGVTVEYDSQVNSIEQEDDLVTVTIESGERLKARWLVGCDGAHSFVRHSQGLSFEGQKRESRWIVGDLHVEGLPLSDRLLLIMHKKGPAGLFPLGNSTYRAVAETETTDEDAESALPKLLQERTQFKALKIQEVQDAGYFSINERQVDQYRVGRVFLAGDSAHVQSPIGGQGMNTGIQDAENLAWKLALVAKGLAKERLLDTYHEERHPVGEWLVETTSRSTDLITSKQPVLAAIRPQATRLLASLPPVQDKLRNTLAELEINYRHSSLSREPQYIGDGWRPRDGIKAGERAPDRIVRFEGEERLLSSAFRHGKFQLLLFSGGRTPEQVKAGPLLRSLERNHSELVQSIYICSSTGSADGVECAVVVDLQQELHQVYAADEPSAYLIRPDGYVAYRCRPIDEVELLNFLDEWAAE